MTDKEEIIIDAVNVGQCKYLNTFTDCDGYHYYCDLADDIKNEYCEHYKNCYFKQLQKEKFENLNNRQMVESAENLIYENSELYKNIKEKEQECEELKKQVETSEKWRIKAESLNEKLDLKNTYYRKALDEIETITKINCEEICGRKFTDCKDTSCFSVNILDIINKAKGEENVK